MGGLIIGLIWIAIGSLIPAGFLRLFAKWVAKSEMDFGPAYKTIFMAVIVNTILMFGFGFMGPVGILFIPVGFCMTAVIVSSRLGLSYGMSCLVTFLTGLMSGIIYFVLFGILTAVGMAALIGAGM